MQLFMRGANLFNGGFGALLPENLQPVTQMQTLPLSPDQIKQGTYTCPITTCPTAPGCPVPPPAPKWPWILAAISGLAVGTGIAAAAIGSRQR